MSLDTQKVEDRFLARGYRSLSQYPALRVFRHREGHEVAWVLTTGRIQIRVNAAVDEAFRGEVAHELHDDLVHMVEHP